MYKSIFAKARQFNIDIYECATEVLELKKPIDSLKELSIQDYKNFTIKYSVKSNFAYKFSRTHILFRGPISRNRCNFMKIIYIIIV